MPAVRHATQPTEAALTIGDIVAARNDFQRSKRRPNDSRNQDTLWLYGVGAVLAATLLGGAVGAALPPGIFYAGYKGRFSNAFGWAYLFCWALAEYPPLYFNYTRQAASTDSLDQIIYYLIGDASYTAFTTILLWSPICKKQLEGCGAQLESLHLNDALFSIHSSTCTLLLLGQLLAYSPRRRHPSLQCWVVIVSVAVIVGGGLVLALQDSSYLTLPGFLYGISFLRIGSCIMEQTPGIESRGWPDSSLQLNLYTSQHVALVLGGTLSLLQQVLDAAISGHWEILSSNFTKLLLAVLTAAFSIVGLFKGVKLSPQQVWDLLRHTDGEKQPELSSREREERIAALNEALVG